MADAANQAQSPVDVFDAGRVETSANTTQSPDPGRKNPNWESNELTVGSMILGYGLAVILISAWLINKGRDSEAVLRLVAVLSAVVVASFLLVVGYDDKQMNPVIGLLGTIVGYLLGKEQGVRAGAREEAARQVDAKLGK